MPIFYSPDYTLAGHAFDTTRKSALVADSLRGEPIPGVTLIEPRPLTADELADVHTPAYVEAVRTGEPPALAQSQGFKWDPGLWRMVCASNGGAVAAALAALDSKGMAGSLSSGLHHAKADRGDGFCTFNGLALAARAAQRAGAGRILIIDLDAHCGGGTAQLLGADPRVHQLDVAVSPSDHYSPPLGWTLDLVHDAADYIPTIKLRLDALTAAREKFDLILYNAGMDPFQESDIGGLDGITFEMLHRRDRLVFDWCRWRAKAPVAFVLAGGYAASDRGRATLTRLHRGTVAAAARVHSARRRVQWKTCPHCSQPMERVRIVYGMPGWELAQAEERGEVVLGGCFMSDIDPRWACPSCQNPLDDLQLEPA